MLDEGDSPATSNVEQTVELDEILRIFSPATKNAFRQWVDYSAQAIEGGTSQDLNDALGNLPEFSQSGSDVLQVLDEEAVRQLIRNTGVVFAALNEQEGALQDLIVNSHRTFEATASSRRRWPRRSRSSPPSSGSRGSRWPGWLEEFSRDTNPLVNDLEAGWPTTWGRTVRDPRPLTGPPARPVRPSPVAA